MNRAGVKRTALNFKGEAGREKKKRRGKAGWRDGPMVVFGCNVPKGGAVIQQESEICWFHCVCVFVCFQIVFNAFLCNDVII